MELTGQHTRSRSRLRTAGVALAIALAWASLPTACSTGERQEPAGAEERAPTANSDSTVALRGVDEAVDASEEGVGLPSSSSQPSDGAGVDPGEGVADPDRSRIEPTAANEPEPGQDSNDSSGKLEEDIESVDAPNITRQADGGEAAQTDDQGNDPRSGDATGAGTFEDDIDTAAASEGDGESSDPHSADDGSIEDPPLEAESASDAEDETADTAFEDRPQMLRLAVPTLSGDLFDVSPLAGRDVLLWFWSPL